MDLFYNLFIVRLHESLCVLKCLELYIKKNKFYWMLILKIEKIEQFILSISDINEEIVFIKRIIIVKYKRQN